MEPLDEPSADVADERLLRDFASSRSPAAFAALFQRYSGLVHAACRRVLGDAAAADDATQATFLVLMRKVPRPAAATCWTCRERRRPPVRR